MEPLWFRGAFCVYCGYNAYEVALAMQSCKEVTVYLSMIYADKRYQEMWKFYCGADLIVRIHRVAGLWIPPKCRSWRTFYEVSSTSYTVAGVPQFHVKPVMPRVPAELRELVLAKVGASILFDVDVDAPLQERAWHDNIEATLSKTFLPQELRQFAGKRGTGTYTIAEPLITSGGL